jgi:hypothetical protein
VRWVEDRDSRVRVIATALEDLRGVMRLRRQRREELEQGLGAPAARSRPTPGTSRIAEYRRRRTGGQPV